MLVVVVVVVVESIAETGVVDDGFVDEAVDFGSMINEKTFTHTVTSYVHTL